MNPLTTISRNQSFFLSRTTMALSLLILVIAPAGIARAQWSSGTDIYNTNSGKVGIGTTTPAAKLEVTGSIYSSASETNTVFSGAVGNNNAALVGPQGYWAFRSDTSHRFNLDVYNSGSPFAAFTVNQSGNVGIGTASPASPAGFTKIMHLSGASNASYVADGGGTSRAEFGVSASGGWLSTGDNLPFRFATNNVERMRIGSSGTVGIGTDTPNSNYKLDVNGDTNITGSFNASGTITGGTIVAKYQDVAEWVESSQDLPTGTVVVLDQTKSNQVIASSHAYDTRVAGVVSAQPGITLGEQSDTKVLVATTGRVKVMVDASSAPIQVGDLLVTSDFAGVAKKSEPLLLGGVPIHRPGTLIGKALEPLAKGRGEILVLLSLQ